jgi:hypothetical protein
MRSIKIERKIDNNGLSLFIGVRWMREENGEWSEE